MIIGALQEIYMNKKRVNEDRLLLRPFPQGIIDDSTRQTLWKKYREDMISRAGVSVFLFGNKLVDADGCSSITYEESKVYDIINNNRFNQNPKKYSCDVCKTVNSLTGSYIAYVDEETFLANPFKYINNAYDKSENDASGYDLTKTR